jgi:cob(I)alamin adenosyltransferase
MSIVTKKGDEGTTGLMYNRRVSKCHLRVEASGAIDELNAALGLARTSGMEEGLNESLCTIQKELVSIMGEIATLPEDADRYVKDGYARVVPEMTARLEAHVNEVESQKISFHGWATPGANRPSAALDMARTICRRAERAACNLKDSNEPLNPEILRYLNRLSDLLWLWARKQEGPPTNTGEPGA